jgi:arylsulfatase A-like enzyme
MQTTLLVTLTLLGCALPQDPAAQATPSEAPARRPNVVLFYADDLGWKDLGCYGNEFHDTPRLDRLASEGMLFRAAYANAPNCAPSRASLMTGLYTPRHGVYTVAPSTRGKAEHRKLLVPKTRKALEPESWTIAEALSEAGYRCASIGKWHLGESPTEQGFEVGTAGTQRGHPKSYFSPYQNPALSDGPAGEHLTARLTAEALDFIDQAKDGPFFLYLPYFSVHTPIQAREDLAAKYRARKGDAEGRLPRPAYAAMVEAMDQSVGMVLDRLEELELAAHTLVLFSSDNGGHGRQTSMAPLRGSKGMLYEGGVREPLIVRWPGRVAPGSVSEEVVIGTDLFPTLLEATGVELAEGRVLDGESIVPALTGGELEREAIYWHFPAYLQGYDKNQRWRTTPASSVRAGRYKLLEFFEDGRLELYDLDRDAGETRDLTDELPEVRERLHGLLVEWRAEVDAPVPSEPNPEYVPD